MNWIMNKLGLFEPGQQQPQGPQLVRHKSGGYVLVEPDDGKEHLSAAIPEDLICRFCVDDLKKIRLHRECVKAIQAAISGKKR